MSEQPKVTKSGVFLGLLLCWPLVLVAALIAFAMVAIVVGALSSATG
jgi:hypothetical protein